MTVRTGILYGVGMGPGDPDLVTLKALKVLGSAGIIASFRKKGSEGHALSIARPHINPNAQLLDFEYPLTTEAHFTSADYVKPIAAFYTRAAKAIADVLDGGSNVALLCEGDPFFYGSFLHMYERIRQRYPVTVIPGVTGMSGCWTAARTPMALGDDVLSVLPGTLDVGRLAEAIARADAAVIMKVGGNLEKIRQALRVVGRLDEAIYVERGTMPAERVIPLVAFTGKAAPYFSIVLVPGCKGRRIR